MDALKLTFVNGETISVAFGVDSSISIETPDGVNGVKRGSWGEITSVEYVTNVSPTVLDPTVSNTQPVEPVAPPVDPTIIDAPPADPSLMQKVADKLGLGHDTVVADTQTAVDVASTGTAVDPAAHLTAALADADAAIAAFPDSVELVDLKTQLEAIQAEQAAPPAGA